MDASTVRPDIEAFVHGLQPDKLTPQERTAIRKALMTQKDREAQLASRRRQERERYNNDPEYRKKVIARNTKNTIARSKTVEYRSRENARKREAYALKKAQNAKEQVNCSQTTLHSFGVAVQPATTIFGHLERGAL